MLYAEAVEEGVRRYFVAGSMVGVRPFEAMVMRSTEDVYVLGWAKLERARTLPRIERCFFSIVYHIDLEYNLTISESSPSGVCPEQV